MGPLMGLDIIAYAQVKPVRKRNDSDEDYAEGRVCFYMVPGFEQQFQGLDENMSYTYEDSYSFGAGSYSGYSEWRGQLAGLAGYGADQLHAGEVADSDFYAQAAWSSNGGPFYELINFSDYEGTIGPLVAAKLLHDFETFDEVAKEHPEEWFYRSYLRWLRAFELAANNGAVRFC